jgi:tetratricopeptide (TPR) repeat protein
VRNLTGIKYVFISFALTTLLFSCKSTSKTSASRTSKLTEKEKLEYEYTFMSACREKLLGNYEQAANIFSKCVQIDPSNAAAMYELATIYNIQKRYTEALLFAKAAASLNEKNEWYQLLYIDILQRSNHYNEAIDAYEKLIKNFPDRIDFMYEYAAALIYANKYQDAIKVYDKIEKATGINEEVIINKQRLYIKLGSVDKAALEIQKLIESNPKESRYYGLLADLYSANGQNKKAFEILSKILEVDPENPYVHLSLADYYRTIGDKNRSFTEIKLAFQNPSLDIDTKMKILLSFYALTENSNELKEQAEELVDILVRVHPTEAKSYSIQGDFYYRDKKLKEARDSYAKALLYDREKFPIWNQLLLLDSELGDYMDMLEKSTEAVDLFPNQPTVFLLKGVAEIQLKKHKEAVATLKQGLSLVVDNNPLLSQFYSYLGDTYHVLNDIKQSDGFYEKALELDPDNVYVLNNYSYYLSLRDQKLDRAAEMSLKSNTIQPNISSYEDTYGWILYQQNKYDDAKTWIEKALNNGGSNSGTILEHYGDIIYKLGDVNKALEYWQKAKEKGGTTEFIDKKINNKKLYE